MRNMVKRRSRTGGLGRALHRKIAEEMIEWEKLIDACHIQVLLANDSCSLTFIWTSALAQEGFFNEGDD